MYKYTLLVLAAVAVGTGGTLLEPFKGYGLCGGDKDGFFTHITAIRTDAPSEDQTVLDVVVGTQYNLQLDFVPGPGFDPHSPISIVVNAVSSKLGIVLSKLLDLGDLCSALVKGSCPLDTGFNYTVQIPLVGCLNLLNTPLNFYDQTVTLLQGNPTTSNDNKLCISYPVRCQSDGLIG